MPVAIAAAAVVGGLLLLFPRTRHHAAVPGTGDAAEAKLRTQVRAAPEDPGPRLALIGHLLQNGRNHDALDEAAEARRRFPESLPVREALADALRVTGRLPEAVRALRPLAGSNPEVRVQLAYLLVLDGRPEEGASMLRAGPDAALPSDLLLRAGQVYLDALHPREALPLFQRVAALQPGDPEARGHAGFALTLLGRYREAVPELQRAAASSPGVPAFHYYLGCALRLSGDLQRLPEAETHLARAAGLTPQDGLFQYELALARVQLRDWAGARAALGAAARLGADYPEIHRDLGRLEQHDQHPEAAALARARYLELLDDAAGAVKELEPLYSRDPRNIKTALAFSVALHGASQFPRAVEVVERLRAREPANIEVLWAQFRLLRSLKRYDQSLAVLDALEKLLPGDTDLMTQRVEVLQTLSRHAEAEGLLARLRDREPNNPARQFQLGQTLALWSTRPDAPQAAEQCLRRAVELRPEYPEAHYTLGLLLQRQKRLDEAAAHLRRALDLAPGNPDALQALGRCYVQLGQGERAAETFRLLRARQALAAQEARLELPVRHLQNLGASRMRLAQYYLANRKPAQGIRQLEMVEHEASDQVATRQWLERLYGHARRFQRQFEERQWLRARGLLEPGTPRAGK